MSLTHRRRTTSQRMLRACTTMLAAVGLLAATAGTASAATCGNAEITNRSFDFISATRGVHTETGLRGNTAEGDFVTVNFTVANTTACQQGVELSFVSYMAFEPYWNPGTASEQRAFTSQNGTFGPGPNSMSVEVPPCHFQIDFVRGAVIERLSPPYDTYSAQGRLLNADNGGTTACPTHQTNPITG